MSPRPTLPPLFCSLASSLLLCHPATAHAQSEPSTASTSADVPVPTTAPDAPTAATPADAPAAPSPSPTPAASSSAPTPAAPAPPASPAAPRSTSVEPAEEPAPRFLRFGSNTRVTFALPSGDAYQGVPLSELAGGLLQLEGTLDAVFLDRLVLGVRLGIGIATRGDQFSTGCREGTNCLTTNVSFGLAGEFLILPRSARFNPWVGLGLSHEVLMYGPDSGTSSPATSVEGGVLDFSAGLDFKAGSIRLGPFFNLRTGKYSSIEHNALGQPSETADIQNQARHNWLMLGGRARF